VKGKLISKGRGDKSNADLLELAKEWHAIGFDFQPDEIQESKPALYLFYKLLMVIQFSLKQNLTNF
jgi:hypothetical protein